MNELGAEDFIYNQIHVLQLFIIIEESVMQSEGVCSKNLLERTPIRLPSSPVTLSSSLLHSN